MNGNVRYVARFAIMGALIIAAYSIDSAVSMLGLPVRIAVVTLIVTLTLMQQFRFGSALFAAGAFGFMSFLFAYMFPNITSPVFMNPLVSIMPRILIGVTCYWSYVGMRKVTARSEHAFIKNLLPRAVSGAVGVLTNTVGVLSMMAVFNGEDVFAKVIAVILSVNFLIELISGLIIVPTVSFLVSKQVRRMKI